MVYGAKTLVQTCICYHYRCLCWRSQLEDTPIIYLACRELDVLIICSYTKFSFMHSVIIKNFDCLRNTTINEHHQTTQRNVTLSVCIHLLSLWLLFQIYCWAQAKALSFHMFSFPDSSGIFSSVAGVYFFSCKSKSPHFNQVCIILFFLIQHVTPILFSQSAAPSHTSHSDILLNQLIFEMLY